VNSNRPADLDEAEHGFQALSKLGKHAATAAVIALIFRKW
jgi:hypothetical protein